MEQTPIETPTPVAPARPNRNWIWWALGGVLLLALIAFSSGYGGYLAAIEQRTAFEVTQVASETQAQFNLALEDIAGKRYEAARQRLEYILRLEPNFPQAQALLADVLVQMSITATPSPQPTPTLTPTPDLRAREELYLQAREQLLNQKWSEAIETLLSLRKKDPTYLAVDIDGMLFVALRNRGVQKISTGDLEGGTYDLSLAQGFGPLDTEARAWREWATLYIRGASFWDVDWAQAVSYFSQLAPLAPNLMDGSFVTASQRYFESMIKYGDWLAQHGSWCDAQAQYEAAMAYRSSPEIQPTAVYALEQCAVGAGGSGEGGSETPSETITPDPNVTPEPTPTLEAGEPTAEPSVTPTP